MLLALIKKVIGNKNDRELKRMGKIVAQINSLESAMSSLSDAQLRDKTTEFKERYQQGKTLDQLLPEAFAVAREASKRVMGMRHFDVQLIGAIALHEGRIAEMRTGEGKTLTATLAVYLNALSGEGVHVITVNDYLAKRDAQWMKPLYEFLNLTVGVVVPGQTNQEKHQAYAADISYGTNSEFGFDYLRDNMAFHWEDKAQRQLKFAIIDEVDSILIDEARTPLIISGAVEDSSALYRRMNVLVPRLVRQEEEVEGHYTIDEKLRQVEFTESGHQYIEDMLVKEGVLKEGESLYSPANLGLLHHVHTALRAHALYQRDVHYIVQDNEVLLIDEHTGRTMQGRRLSEGLHQAIEAKEGVSIRSESQTLASTTYQNFFRLYDKLSGMTGTADTEAFEFRQIYGLDVVVIPTNQPMIRKDFNDLVYLTVDEKYDAILEDVRECMASNRPVLVGTASIETSETVSSVLKKNNIQHQVLNAKFHAQEAEIIAQAGRPGAVTIATNMAGRGTDIVLGGNWQAEINTLNNPTSEQVDTIKANWQILHDEVIASGGLHIIGTERHESRRIDNQLRGRAGRQGDPGSSRFYLSMDDQLLRLFAGDRVKNAMKMLGMQKGEAIESPLVSNSIEKAQRKVEGRNFDIRKQLLEYDDVANDQRSVIYQQRDELMLESNISEMVSAIRHEIVDKAIDGFIPPQSLEEQWDAAGLEQYLAVEFNCTAPIRQWLDEDSTLHEEPLRERIIQEVDEAYNQKKQAAQSIGINMQDIEKRFMLHILDEQWKNHLSAMDHLRQGIHLRGYAQKNPKQEYKKEAFELFQYMLEAIKRELIKVLTHVEIRSQAEIDEMERQKQEELDRQVLQQQKQADQFALFKEQRQNVISDHIPYRRDTEKVGRNDPCPCGSGKKFKQCHGALTD